MTTDRMIRFLAAATAAYVATAQLQALPTEGVYVENNCFACHGQLIDDQPDNAPLSQQQDGRVITGKMKVTDLGMKIDLGTQLDGEVRGALQTIQAAAGSTVSLQLDVEDGVDSHAIQLKGFETGGQFSQTGHHLVWADANEPAAGWWRYPLKDLDNPDAPDLTPPYFATDPLMDEDPRTHSFELAVDPTTPPDIYNLTFAVAGLDGSGLYFQEEHFYLQVTGGGAVAGPDDKMVNLSTRGTLTEAEIITPGFVITGTVPRTVLVRVMGPALGDFGITTACPNPGLTLYQAGVTDPIASNTKWGDAPNFSELKSTANAIGAWPFSDDSLDAAVLITLAPGAYTLQADSGGLGGEVVAEVYDASGAE